MAYVPPHRRLMTESSSVRPTPVAPPSGKQNRDKYGKQRGRNGSLKPDIRIKYSGNRIRRWLAVDGVGDASHLSLEFKPFLGESFEHLRDFKLYTLARVPPGIGGSEVENSLQSLTLNVMEPWKYIYERIKCDFHNAFLNVDKHLEMSKPNLVKPTLFARFGKILFHGMSSWLAWPQAFGRVLSRSGCVGLAWLENISPDIVEKTLMGDKGVQNALNRTFDNSLPKDIFEALKERAITKMDATRLKEKESYFIQVEDNMRPHVILGCTCVKSNSKDTEQLELKRIKMEPVRHLVADISCLNKCSDLRLILITEEYLTQLTEEEKVCIEQIVKSARIDESAKGGLHWPLGGDNVSSRFQVRGSWHRNKTTIIGKMWKLVLQHVNRTEFKASSGRVSYEVQLKLTKLTRYLKDQMQWDKENILGILEEIVKWIWTEMLID